MQPFAIFFDVFYIYNFIIYLLEEDLQVMLWAIGVPHLSPKRFKTLTWIFNLVILHHASMEIACASVQALGGPTCDERKGSHSIKSPSPWFKITIVIDPKNCISASVVAALSSMSFLQPQKKKKI